MIIVNFSDLLSRADEEVMQSILGSNVLKLVGTLDQSYLSPQSLKKMVLGLYSPYSLLTSAKHRILLLELLRRDEAENLVSMLLLESNGDPYSALVSCRFSRRAHIAALLQFLEVEVPEEEIAHEHNIVTLSETKYPLFEHQRRVVKKIIAELLRLPNRVLLHMPTGSGKTRTAMNVIAEHFRRSDKGLVIWLANSEELCEQAASEFETAWRYLGDRDLPVYRLWGGNNIDVDSMHDGFVVAGMAQMFSQAKRSMQYISKLGSKASFVIMDEAHQATAPTYKLVLDALVVPFPNTMLLGLSATPGRTWNDPEADEELSNFFSRRKVTLEVPGYDSPVEYLVNEGYLARIKPKPLLHNSGINLSAMDTKYIEEHFELPNSILDALATDEMRNLKIIGEVESLVKRHKRIILFALSVSHSELLATVLQLRGIRANSISSNTPSQDRKEILESYKGDDDETQVLCNYGVLSTGFDAPKTSAAVIARPTESLVLYSQMVGRAIRGTKANGNSEAEIVTVVDVELPGFKSLEEAFHNWEDVWRIEA